LQADEEETGTSSDKLDEPETEASTNADEGASETASLSASQPASPPPEEVTDEDDESEDVGKEAPIVPAASVAAATGPQALSGEELARKIKSSIDEYKDSEETDDSADLVRGQSDEVVAALLRAMFSAAAEGKDRDRAIFPNLLTALVGTHKVVEQRQLELALSTFAETFDDLAIDFPNAPKALAPFIVNAIKLNKLSLDSLPSILVKCNVGQNAAKIAMAVYNDLIAKMGDAGKALIQTIDFKLFFDADQREASAEKFMSRNSDFKALLS